MYTPIHVTNRIAARNKYATKINKQFVFAGTLVNARRTELLAITSAYS